MTTKETLEMLRAHGVKSARIDDAGNLREVEFFGDGQPTEGASADDTLHEQLITGEIGVEDYEQALSQIRSRRFPKKDAVA